MIVHQELASRRRRAVTITYSSAAARDKTIKLLIINSSLFRRPSNLIQYRLNGCDL